MSFLKVVTLYLHCRQQLGHWQKPLSHMQCTTLNQTLLDIGLSVRTQRSESTALEEFSSKVQSRCNVPLSRCVIRAGHCPDQLTRVGGPPLTFNRFYNKELFCRHVFKKKNDLPTKRVVEYSPISPICLSCPFGEGFCCYKCFC